VMSACGAAAWAASPRPIPTVSLGHGESLVMEQPLLWVKYLSTSPGLKSNKLIILIFIASSNIEVSFLVYGLEADLLFHNANAIWPNPLFERP
jgi:hypothetical protein